MELFSFATIAKCVSLEKSTNNIGISLLPLEVPKELQSETEPEKGALDKGLQARERKGHSCGRNKGFVWVMV